MAAEIPDLFGGPARLLAGTAAGLDLLAIDAPHLYGRPGDPYLAPDGTDWPDNAARFGALGSVAARIGTGLLPDYRPDVVHGHDWQAGLAPAYLHFARAPAGPRSPARWRRRTTSPIRGSSRPGRWRGSACPRRPTAPRASSSTAR